MLKSTCLSRLIPRMTSVHSFFFLQSDMCHITDACTTSSDLGAGCSVKMAFHFALLAFDDECGLSFYVMINVCSSWHDLVMCILPPSHGCFGLFFTVTRSSKDSAASTSQLTEISSRSGTSSKSLLDRSVSMNHFFDACAAML